MENETHTKQPTTPPAPKVSRPKLRMMTYLCPGLPLGLFQTYQYYLEDVLGHEIFLSVESRRSGPAKEYTDPFTNNDIDLAFMCSTSYVRLMDERNEFAELLPIAPVYDHPDTMGRPIYFTEIVIRKERITLHKEFADLRGGRWASVDHETLDGNIAVLHHLRKLGVNASFFGHIVHTDCQQEALNRVALNLADMAAVDSTTLQLYMEEHPEEAKELHVLCSLGPWPAQPIIVNSRMSHEMKTKIADALKNATQHPKYGDLFRRFKVKDFISIDSSIYNMTRNILESVKHQDMYPAYY